MPGDFCARFKTRQRFAGWNPAKIWLTKRIRGIYSYALINTYLQKYIYIYELYDCLKYEASATSNHHETWLLRSLAKESTVDWRLPWTTAPLHHPRYNITLPAFIYIYIKSLTLNTRLFNAVITHIYYK